MTDLDALIREYRDLPRVASTQWADKLADALETLRADRDAALAREAALTEALREIGRTAYLLAPAAEPEASACVVDENGGLSSAGSAPAAARGRVPSRPENPS